MKKSFIVIIALILLSACTSRYASNGENMYMKSRSGKPLIVPPPLTNNHGSHFYDLPPQDNSANVSIAPPLD